MPDQLSQFFVLLAEDESLRLEIAETDSPLTKALEVASRQGLYFSEEQLRARVSPITDEEWYEATDCFDKHHTGTYILFLEEVPMSKEALNAFFKKVADDEGLQKKLVEFAAQQGFEFGPEELSDSDLDGVAGGVISPITARTKIEPVTEMKVEDVRLTDK
jgi:hypothetical protein